MTTRPIRSVYFKKLVLENIRAFSKRQTLTLEGSDGKPAQWTLIVGDNGVGKTTLLQCLARMQPAFNKPPDENSGPKPAPVEPEFAGEENNAVLDAFARSGANTIAKLEAELSCGVPLAGRRTPRRGTICTRVNITRQKDELTSFKSGGTSPPNVEEPLVLAYGAGRHPKTTNVDKVVATGLVESLFKVESTLHDAEDLLYRLEFGSLKGDEQAGKRLNSLKRMLAEILPDVGDPRDIEILGPPISASSSEPKGVRVAIDDTKVPLSQLSLGYQTVFAWTLDIAWRLLERYPNSPNPLQEPAIVIVDEVDLHLHPRWQRAVREHLTRHFPKVQFIATAHSPLMAQSSLAENLAVLHKSDDHVVILNDPSVIKEWRLDQVITSELFGLDSARSPEVDQLLARRNQLADKTSLSAEEQQELEHLDAQVGDFPTAETPSDQSAMEIIRRAAAALQEAG